IRGEEGFDVLMGKEVRCALGPVKHADFPGVGIARNQVRRGTKACRRRCGRLCEMQHVAGAERASAMAAEASERESRFGAEIIGYVEASGDRKIGAATVA